MQKDPVDFILEKIVCELLKQEEISTISQTSLTSMVDLIRNYICEIGRFANREATETSLAKVSINELLLGIMSKCSLYDLYDYMKAGKLPTIYGYNFPNSSFSQTVEIPLSQINDDLPAFYKPFPLAHNAKATPMLGVERDQDKAMNRKRLLEERLSVKKSICLVNDTNTVLWETREMQEQQKQTIGEEGLPTLPTNTSVSKNPSRIPEMLKNKPVTTETENGIGVN